MSTTEEFIEALEDAGYEWRAYSGRAMYGKQCVGVVLKGDFDLWHLARNLRDINVEAPRTDSMGHNIIVYWPRYEINEAEASAS